MSILSPQGSLKEGTQKCFEVFSLQGRHKHPEPVPPAPEEHTATLSLLLPSGRAHPAMTYAFPSGRAQVPVAHTFPSEMAHGHP